MTITDPDTARGLYGKYEVRKAIQPGTTQLGANPWLADVFVLNYTKDPHAAVALAAYATSCAADYPQLAADLREKLRGQPECECDEPACAWCEIHGDTHNRDDECSCPSDAVHAWCPEHGQPNDGYGT